MKAFVFKTSNAYIGKFDLESTDQVSEALMQFGKSQPLSPYDYVECDGKTWTLVMGSNGLELKEGREYATESIGLFSESSKENRTSDVPSRYNEAYTTAEVICSIGRVIKIIAIVFGFILISAGLIIGSSAWGFQKVIIIFGSLIIGALVGIILHVIGVLIITQGQVLKATLDTAVHTSPFMTDAQRALAMRIKP